MVQETIDPETLNNLEAIAREAERFRLDSLSRAVFYGASGLVSLAAGLSGFYFFWSANLGLKYKIPGMLSCAYLSARVAPDLLKDAADEYSSRNILKKLNRIE